MIEFENEQLSAQDAFWVMYYFLEEHYKLSGGTFDVSDILAASAPVEFNSKGHFDTQVTGNRPMAPIDSGMISFWNEAIEKYKREGMPPAMKFER